MHIPEAECTERQPIIAPTGVETMEVLIPLKSWLTVTTKKIKLPANGCSGGKRSKLKRWGLKPGQTEL